MKKNWENQEARDLSVSEILSQGDNVIIAIDFNLGQVERIIPVRLNRYGECINFSEIKEKINEVGCGPRKPKHQPLPKIFDTDSILIFDQIA